MCIRFVDAQIAKNVTLLENSNLSVSVLRVGCFVLTLMSSLGFL